MGKMNGNDLEKLRRIRHVVMDMDGTIYHGKRLYPTTLPFLDTLRSLGIGFTFLTNNSSRGTAEYLEHLKSFGIFVDKKNMLVSTLGTVRHLKKHYGNIRKLFLLGTPSFRREIVEYGFLDVGMDEEPDGVVTAFDTSLTYERLCKAAWWIKRGKLWLATHGDLECPTDLATTLVDCGSIAACLSRVSGRTPVMLGKPQKEMMDPVLDETGLKPDEVAMCGDRIATDILLAVNAGTRSVHIAGERAADSPADWTVPDLGVFGEMLRLARTGGESI